MKVHLELDSLLVVNMLNNQEWAQQFNPMLSKVKDLLNIEWLVKISHTLREGSKCADKLPNLTFDMETSQRWYPLPS